MFWPVIYAPPSDANNSTTAEISETFPYLWRGIRFKNSSLADKLSMKPGKMLFILILSFAYLSEYILVKADKPDLNTPDVGKFFSGSKTANVDMFMIEPFFYFCIIGVMTLAALTTFR